jgi:predicted transposase YbfD/YdcC
MFAIADYEETDTLNAVFDSLEDPRIERNKLYPLGEVLFLTLVAAICGIKSWREIEYFGTCRLLLLRRYMPFEHGIPSHQTIGRVFSLIKPSAFEAAFIACMEKFSTKYAGEIIAMDGKTIRNSYDRSKGLSAIHMVNVWSVNNGLVLAQRAVPSNGNEIDTVVQLLEILNIKGATITLDAMHCQKSTVQKVLRNGADYVIALKGNQKILHENVKDYFEREALPYGEKDFFETTDKGHGRVEHRKYFVHEVSEWLENREEWLGLTSVGMVISDVTRNGQTRSECRFYLMSIAPDAQRFAECCRGHWHIENKLHWVLDVSYGEDASLKRKDNAPRNYALIRKFALNLLHKNKEKRNKPYNRKTRAILDPDYVHEILQQGGFK